MSLPCILCVHIPIHFLSNQKISVRITITHIMVRCQGGKVNHRCSCVIISTESVNDPFICRTDKRITANVTSYAIAWVIAQGTLLVHLLNLKLIQLRRWSKPSKTIFPVAFENGCRPVTDKRGLYFL